MSDFFFYKVSFDYLIVLKKRLHLTHAKLSLDGFARSCYPYLNKNLFSCVSDEGFRKHVFGTQKL